MAEGAEIRARIKSVAETKKVTDAMNMISSVKLRRAKSEVENTTPYFKALKEEIGRLFLHIPETSSRYFKVPDPAEGAHMKHGIFLVTSDKGLVGAYNRNVISLCEEYIGHHPETVVFILGEYGRQYFASRGIPFVEDFRYSSELPNVWKARRICADLLEYFNDGRVDEINVIYTDYISGRPSMCKRNVLLPLKRSRFASEKSAEDPTETEFFPDPDTVLSGIIPSYLTGFIYGCLVDSYCAEQQARMNAMSGASRNAEEMLKELRLRYNGIRQAAITREMTEISSGALALRKKKAASESKTEDGPDEK
ncbi:MAG: ATP synthase F1 subunit gamma [Clostridia bacterium]|nr:ATP synthase F1 subunit gamma [Clostridia bacterium]